mgnify:CR=1 FL=1
MILSPLQSEKTITGQKKPVITQRFLDRPEFYKPLGLPSHGGLDFRAKVGTPLFAPIDGKVTVINKGPYGLHVYIQNDRLKCLLAHLSSVACHTGQIIRMGEAVGLTGASGNVEGEHLHMEMYKMHGDALADPKDPYKSRFDFEPYVITWRGSLTSDELIYS